MRISVEFLGLSRLITGTKARDFDLIKGTTFQELVRVLGTTYPAMIGDVIQSNGSALQSPNIFNVDGKRMIQQNQMQDSLNDGDRIVLMSMSAGG
ncbi:MAG: MoaD/ThiS family protein [Anaerolineae bacterium]|nr:MoaD/ThiS family protein [Anaerolineae bacterium]